MVVDRTKRKGNMISIMSSYPGFHALPRGIKQLLVASESNFFDAAKYPKMNFAMTKYTAQKNGKAKIAGNLTIRGITKPVVFDAEVSKPVLDPWGGTRIGMALNTKVNRKDFGLNWNKALEAGGFVVGDEIKIDVELEGIAK